MNIYKLKEVEEMVEDDEMNATDAGFMQGYMGEQEF